MIHNDNEAHSVSRLSSTDSGLMVWLDHIVTTVSERANDMRDPRSVIASCIRLLQEILPNSSGETPSYDWIVTTTRTAISSLYLAAETFYPVPPQILNDFEEGWDVDLNDKDSVQSRKTVVRALEEELFLHLSGYIDFGRIPNHCVGDCHCQVQQSPVGDRGGIPRRVPCARQELIQCPEMQRVFIHMVSL